MSNADYENRTSASFATYVKNDVRLAPLDTVVDYTDFNFDTTDPIQPGDGALVDDEIMMVDVVGIRTFTVKRGCADTVPAEHLPGSIVWILSNSTGTDQVERSAGETVTVKVAPFTVGGGQIPIANVAPDRVDFNWRFFRPYPPAFVFVNAARWYEPVVIDDFTGSANLSWVHRDRIVQADRLLGHNDPSIGPEAGVTYTLRVYTAEGSLLRTEYGIVGQDFMYQHAKALHDMGYPAAPTPGLLTFTASRQNFDAWQDYRIAITVVPSASPIPSQWQAFEQRAFEAPYQWNVRAGQSGELSTGLGVAARPADRMSDDYALVRYWIEDVDTGEVDENDDPIYEQVPHTDVFDTKTYTPWLTSDFRLPELEQTFNVRSSSLYDGVTPANVPVGTLAMIDDELVELRAFNTDGTVTIGRGCCDTVPQVHVAGARMWLFEAAAAIDLDAAPQVAYRFRPGVYGAPVDAATLPVQPVTFNDRPARPLPPGQIVVNGRPWFEEAQALSGQGVLFSWAWRNRIAQGDAIVSHEMGTDTREPGSSTTLRFFYETPATTPNGAAVEHLLREFQITTSTFTYPYENAIADGNAAGLALGVCGTVVIYCRISSTRDNLASWQSYRVPVRVPSYPCPA